MVRGAGDAAGVLERENPVSWERGAQAAADVRLTGTLGQT